MEVTIDYKHRNVTGVYIFSANEKESLSSSASSGTTEKQLNLSMEKVALDKGYDTGIVHRSLKLLGTDGYIPAIRFTNDPSKYRFSYYSQ